MSEENQSQDGEDRKLFPPYVVDAPVKKVQTIRTNAGIDYLTTHAFKTLNSKNFALLITREKEIVRTSESLTKDKSRDHFSTTLADKNLYNAIVLEGETREYGADQALQVHTREDLLGFAQERKKDAIFKYLECHVEVISEGTGLDFLYEGEPMMTVQLSIGDRDDPAYRFLIQYKRPESTARDRFTDNFAYNVDERKGDLPIKQTVIDVRKATANFDGAFGGIVKDPLLSQVVFLNPEWTKEAGQDVPRVIEYDDSKRTRFLEEINPQFKTEVAAKVSRYINKAEGK